MHLQVNLPMRHIKEGTQKLTPIAGSLLLTYVENTVCVHPYKKSIVVYCPIESTDAG